MDEFSRKFWYFFVATMVLTAFFSILLSPGSWLVSEEWEFALVDLRTWGLVPRTLLQAVVGVVLLPLLLRGLKAYAPWCRTLMLIFPAVPMALHIYLGTPNSGLLIVLLWGIFIYTNLLQSDVRQAFQPQYRAELHTASSL